MKVFNSATQAVKQGGTRGAEHGHREVDITRISGIHQCKESDKEITQNFNISIAITEDIHEQGDRGRGIFFDRPAYNHQGSQKTQSKRGPLSLSWTWRGRTGAGHSFY